MIMTMSSPVCAELPRAILAIINEEPSGAIALKWRRYARVGLVPAVRQIAEILKANAAAIEVKDRAISFESCNSVQFFLYS